MWFSVALSKFHWIGINWHVFNQSRQKPNLERTSKYGFPPIWGKNGGVLSMRMQVILDSRFARPNSAPIGGGKKEEFRDWTSWKPKAYTSCDPYLKVFKNNLYLIL